MGIKDYVGEKMALKELKEQELDKSFYNVKFSVNVDEVLNRRLKSVSAELSVTRAELVRDLVEMALGEVEEQLGLNPHDFDSDYANKLYEGMDKVPLSDLNGNVILSVPKADFIDMVKRGRNND